MSDSWPAVFFRVNDLLSVFLDKNGNWIVADYNGHENVVKEAFGHFLRRCLDDLELNGVLVHPDSRRIELLPTCYVEFGGGSWRIKSYYNGEIIRDLKSGAVTIFDGYFITTDQITAIDTRDFREYNCQGDSNTIEYGPAIAFTIGGDRLAITRYGDNTTDLPSAAIVGYQLHYVSHIQNHILISATDIIDVKNTEKYSLLINKISPGLVMITIVCA